MSAAPPVTGPYGPHAQCHVCNLVVSVPEGDTHGLACPRCRSPIHRRKPNSLSRTWALLLSAAICYVPANLYPVMEVTTLGVSQADTILSGIIYLAVNGTWPLATPIASCTSFVRKSDSRTGPIRTTTRCTPQPAPTSMPCLIAAR